MLDLHCHILPGIDDGADSWDESLEMAKISAAGGVKTIVATPHYSKEISVFQVTSLVQEFNSRLDKAKIPLQIVPGMEAYLDPQLPELLKTEKILLLGGKFLLVELPMTQLPFYTDEVLFKVMLQGYQVILAHPERNLQVSENPGLVYDWVSKGILVQINSGSLLGSFGSVVRKTCEGLLKARLVHFLGSDAHSSRSRRPDLDKAFASLKQIVTNPRQICEENGSLVLLNKFSPHDNFDPPLLVKQAWWKKLLS